MRHGRKIRLSPMANDKKIPIEGRYVRCSKMTCGIGIKLLSTIDVIKNQNIPKAMSGWRDDILAAMKRIPAKKIMLKNVASSRK